MGALANRCLVLVLSLPRGSHTCICQLVYICMNAWVLSKCCFIIIALPCSCSTVLCLARYFFTAFFGGFMPCFLTSRNKITAHSYLIGYAIFRSFISTAAIFCFWSIYLLIILYCMLFSHMQLNAS